MYSTGTATGVRDRTVNRHYTKLSATVMVLLLPVPGTINYIVPGSTWYCTVHLCHPKTCKKELYWTTANTSYCVLAEKSARQPFLVFEFLFYRVDNN
jgi:hypothetical protein